MEEGLAYFLNISRKILRFSPIFIYRTLWLCIRAALFRVIFGAFFLQIWAEWPYRRPCLKKKKLFSIQLILMGIRRFQSVSLWRLWKQGSKSDSIRKNRNFEGNLQKRFEDSDRTEFDTSRTETVPNILTKYLTNQMKVFSHRIGSWMNDLIRVKLSKPGEEIIHNDSLWKHDFWRKPDD